MSSFEIQNCSTVSATEISGRVNIHTINIFGTPVASTSMPVPTPEPQVTNPAASPPPGPSPEPLVAAAPEPTPKPEVPALEAPAVAAPVSTQPEGVPDAAPAAAAPVPTQPEALAPAAPAAAAPEPLIAAIAAIAAAGQHANQAPLEHVSRDVLIKVFTVPAHLLFILDPRCNLWEARVQCDSLRQLIRHFAPHVYLRVRTSKHQYIGLFYEHVVADYGVFFGY